MNRNQTSSTSFSQDCSTPVLKSGFLINNITSTQLIFLTSLFLVVFANQTFFSNVTDVYPVHFKNIAFLSSLVLVLGCAMILLLSLLCNKHTIKPLLLIILFISAFASYFMDTYNVVIDDTMIQNLVNTDPAESMNLMSLKLILYVTLLAILPSVWVYKIKLVYAGVKAEVVSRIKLCSLSLALVLIIGLIFGGHYASFFREHKILRYYANPSSSIYATVKYIDQSIERESLPLVPIGLDAKIP